MYEILMAFIVALVIGFGFRIGWTLVDRLEDALDTYMEERDGKNS